MIFAPCFLKPLMTWSSLPVDSSKSTYSNPPSTASVRTLSLSVSDLSKDPFSDKGLFVPMMGRSTARATFFSP